MEAAPLTRFDELARAARALGDANDAQIALLREMPTGWSDRGAGAPLLPSGIKHGVPWGVSRAGDEWRVLVEPQADPPAARAYWDAGRRLTAWIGRQPGADLTSLAAIEDLFTPEDPTAAFRVWHMVAFRPGHAPRFKIYLCPGARGTGRAPETLQAALQRLGHGDPPELRPEDRVTILSLDLTAEPLTKLYVLMPDATPGDVARLHDQAEGAVPGDPRRFAEAMLDDPGRPLWWLVALAFAARAPRPSGAALHLGVPRHVPDPAIARARAAALAKTRVPADLHFVSFQRRGGAPRTTLYFLPEVRR